jgi:hypothetical protein
MPIKPVFAPRLSQADQQEITASRKTPPRAMPILLGIAIVMFIATGASLYRERARSAKRAAAQATQLEAKPQLDKPAAVAAPAPPAIAAPQAKPVAAIAPAALPPAASAQPPAPAPAPPPAPAPAAAEAPAKVGGAALDAEAFAALEKRAVDKLRDNDHEAALALYVELARAEPQNPAFPVMVSLLTRRVRACQGDPSCAR